MFFDEGKQWGRSRRLISPNFVGHNLTAMIPCIVKVRSLKDSCWCCVGAKKDRYLLIDVRLTFSIEYGEYRC